MKAADVRVGDLILSPYKPRTWQRVEKTAVDGSLSRYVMIDTGTDRTWWEPGDLVPCKPVKYPLKKAEAS